MVWHQPMTGGDLIIDQLPKVLQASFVIFKLISPRLLPSTILLTSIELSTTAATS